MILDMENCSQKHRERVWVMVMVMVMVMVVGVGVVVVVVHSSWLYKLSGQYTHITS